jgi:hypothetical protein
MFRLFLLGTVFLIRTASEKMFLIRTDRVKYIEKKDFLLNGLFLWLNWKISFRARIEKCSLTDGTLTSSGWSQTDLSYDVSNDINLRVQSLICQCKSKQRFVYNFDLIDRNLVFSRERNGKKHDLNLFYLLSENRLLWRYFKQNLIKIMIQIMYTSENPILTSWW